MISLIKVLFLVLFLYYSDIVLDISLLFHYYLLNIYVLYIILYREYCKWYQSSFQGMTCGVNFFFRVETYSGVFKLQISIITHINPRSGSHTCRKYKWFLSAHLLATHVTHIATPSSGSASNNTCIWIDLGIPKPSIDKLIDRLTVIVSPRTTLGKIISRTWVVELYD